jgi:C1A family cysteine protease
MKSVAILVLVAVAGVAALSERDYQDQFVNWMGTFDKTYAHEEFFARFNTFKSWVDFVAVHNAGNHTWQAGLNQFSDLTPAQFAAQQLTGLLSEPIEPTAENMAVFTPENDIDWRSKGAVTPVKNQGQCGSCWAFSAIGIIEGWSFNKDGVLHDLSEQQINDCAGAFGNQGCNGGWHDKAVDWAATKGNCKQADYPYKARNQVCQTTCTAVTKPNPSAPKGTTEAALASALEKGPVGVAVDASGGFQSYHSGVFSGPCGTQLNHAILAVGSGTSGAQKYWIVKNSWGTTWGDKGYISLVQGKNQCGVNMHTAWVKA